MKRLISTLLIVFTGLLAYCYAQTPTYEGLTELISRSSRSASWVYSYFEDPTTKRWQPESVMYTAVDGALTPYGATGAPIVGGSVGAEVWRVAGVPNYHSTQTGLSHSFFSGDGRWVAFWTTRPTSFWTPDTNSPACWFLASTDGAFVLPFRGATISSGSTSPIAGPPQRLAKNGITKYIEWNPQQPAEFWMPGYNKVRVGLAASKAYYIYRCVVASDGIITGGKDGTDEGTNIIDTSGTDAFGGVGNTNQKYIEKGMSGDGLKLLVYDGVQSPFKMIPCTITGSTAVADHKPGWSIYRSQGSGYDQSAAYTKFHGDAIWARGNSTTGYLLFLQPGSPIDALWRCGVLGGSGFGGTDTDYGPLRVAGHDEDAASEVMIVGVNSGTPPSWTKNYQMAHASLDQWGRCFVSWANQLSPFKTMYGCFDIIAQKTPATATTFPGGADTALIGSGTNYNDYSAFSDYAAMTGGWSGDSNLRLAIFKVNGAYGVANIKQIMRIYKKFHADETDPHSGQSKDGTKIHFPSDFLNASGKADFYYAVAYYPYPGQITTAAAVAGGVRLTIAPKSYTTRGWPAEGGTPPEPKEIKQFHVWKSPNGTDTWTETAETAATPVPFATRTVDVAQSNSTTAYYALTSEEYSHLESRRLGNVRKITLDGSGNISNGGGAGEETTAYPASPGDISPFFTTASSNVSGLTVTGVGVLPAGHHQLAWTEPSGSKVRHYNIYYSNASDPAATQANRIASVPVGTSTWRDGNAVQVPDTYHYRVTTVDRQGNESAGVTGSETVPEDTTPPAIIISVPADNPHNNGTSPTFLISGTASDNVGVSYISWSNSLGGSGTADGTTDWSAAITLINGTNIITMTAHDAALNTASAPKTVIYTSPYTGGTTSRMRIRTIP